MTHVESSQTSMEDMVREMMLLKAENAKLKANTKSNIKVSTKGAVSVYGFGRWPVTLYKSQWLKLFAMVEQVADFIKANDHLLATKED